MLALCPIRDHRTPLGVPCSELYAETLQALEEVQRNKITAEAFEDWFRYSHLNKDEAELLELLAVMTFEGHVVNA